jgi:hypothetical protein
MLLFPTLKRRRARSTPCALSCRCCSRCRRTRLSGGAGTREWLINARAVPNPGAVDWDVRLRPERAAVEVAVIDVAAVAGLRGVVADLSAAFAAPRLAGGRVRA